MNACASIPVRESSFVNFLLVAVELCQFLQKLQAGSADPQRWSDIFFVTSAFTSHPKSCNPAN